MGKENTRTLKNINYNAKKNSKKNSKKKSRKNKKDNSTTEEMRQILDSENHSNNFMSKNVQSNGLVQYDGEVPQMGMPQMGMQGMQGMGGHGMMQGMDPQNYDSLMLQQFAPSQTSQNVPANLLSASGMAAQMSHGPQMAPQMAPQMPSGMVGGGRISMQVIKNLAMLGGKKINLKK